MTNVMTREETFEYISEIAAAVFAGRPIPDDTGYAAFMRAEDIGDAMADVNRRLADGFDDKIAKHFKGNVKVQEMLRAMFDETNSENALALEKLVAGLPRV